MSFVGYLVSLIVALLAAYPLDLLAFKVQSQSPACSFSQPQQIGGDILVNTTNFWEPEGLSDMATSNQSAAVVYYDDLNIKAVIYRPQSGWSAAQTLGRIPSTFVYRNEPKIAVDRYGNAVVVFYGCLGTGTCELLSEDLWMARYDRINGWQTPIAIDGGFEFIARTSLEMDKNGNAVVVFAGLPHLSMSSDLISIYSVNISAPTGTWSGPNLAENIAGEVILEGFSMARGSNLAALIFYNYATEQYFISSFEPATGWGVATPIPNGGLYIWRLFPEIDDQGNTMIGIAASARIDSGYHDNYALRYLRGFGFQPLQLVENQTGIIDYPVVAVNSYGDTIIGQSIPYTLHNPHPKITARTFSASSATWGNDELIVSTEISNSYLVGVLDMVYFDSGKVAVRYDHDRSLNPSISDLVVRYRQLNGSLTPEVNVNGNIDMFNRTRMGKIGEPDQLMVVFNSQKNIGNNFYYTLFATACR